MTEFISNREIYEQVIRDRVPLARKRLWIATADIKDMYVDSSGRDMVPFLEVLSELVARGIEIRLIHAKEPGPNFREDFDRCPPAVSTNGAGTLSACSLQVRHNRWHVRVVWERESNWSRDGGKVLA